MSRASDGTSLACIDWVARQSIDYLYYQFAVFRPHYVGAMGDTPRDYMLHALRTHYIISPRGWQRQFRRRPAKLATRVYHRICVDLGGRP